MLEDRNQRCLEFGIDTPEVLRMPNPKPRLIGFELYFEDLEGARGFYCDTLGLDLSEEMAGHHAKFDSSGGFLCLERKGSESYPSQDKAVVFLEVADLEGTVQKIGRGRFLQIEPKGSGGHPPWAVLHDPEGHNVLILEKRATG
jgi:predicted enzyme related to lactoylglutathione lyase